MDDFVSISNLNDFLFCPFSIYLHRIYQSSDSEQYHQPQQTQGKIAHRTIDNANYSTSNKVITSMPVYSQEYQLIGVIDQLFLEWARLVETKQRIEFVYRGQQLQLHAQYLCLKEMGYKVSELQLYSKSTNKKFSVDLPDFLDEIEITNIVSQIKNFNPETFDDTAVLANKCNKCIYSELCFYKKDNL